MASAQCIHRRARPASQVCTFNDDMQGTVAVVLAAAFAAVQATGSRMRD
jgi:malate dehydrogenase (oxaloacetate-decarboxylating)